MAKTNDPAVKRSETPLGPIHAFYRDIMDLIERMPHVGVDLDVLARLDANREGVLRWLALAVFAPNFITVKQLKEREAALRNLANNLNVLAARVDQVLSDQMSSADSWVRPVGYAHEVDVEARYRPVDAAERIWKCAKWAERNAEALSQLRAAEQKTQGNATINELFKYVRKNTGKNCAAILARLRTPSEIRST